MSQSIKRMLVANKTYIRSVKGEKSKTIAAEIITYFSATYAIFGEKKIQNSHTMSVAEEEL